MAHYHVARIAQLGERQTKDLKVMCSIHVHRKKNRISLSSGHLLLIQLQLYIATLGRVYEL